MVQLTDRITLDENLCNGKPTIRGLRITVQTILEFLANGDSKEDILYQYPDLDEKDIEACLIYASRISGNSFSIKEFAA